jgi:hypothetical protein
MHIIKRRTDDTINKVGVRFIESVRDDRQKLEGIVMSEASRQSGAWFLPRVYRFPQLASQNAHESILLPTCARP